VNVTLRKLLFAASGETGSRRPGGGTPNLFGMVVQGTDLLACLSAPAGLPVWLPNADFNRLVHAPAIRLYRRIETTEIWIDWRLRQGDSGEPVQVPPLFMIGEPDDGRPIIGINKITAARPSLVSRLAQLLCSQSGRVLASGRASHELLELTIKFPSQL
jgi:hypothetical protein